eukprot:TRINITY_DN5064_c0_g1_i1.p1 TRINITY_DN5064_c0_g1~~TRINITY_DN5064_c0_g1_i1.p1  ORF type:complete len:229 (-),score=60.42 TRINITY_DN5064_c0_g1_i1:13-699(-)
MGCTNSTFGKRRRKETDPPSSQPHPTNNFLNGSNPPKTRDNPYSLDRGGPNDSADTGYKDSDPNKKPRPPDNFDSSVYPTNSHQSSPPASPRQQTPTNTSSRPSHEKTREEMTSNDHHMNNAALLRTSYNTTPNNNFSSTGATTSGSTTLSNSNGTTGSVIRNGVYYSESELSEEAAVWQPRYWTPDRIAKWVEDIEVTPTGVIDPSPAVGRTLSSLPYPSSSSITSY